MRKRFPPGAHFMNNTVTIVGFGLAGACCALELRRRGCPLRIIDAVRPGAASPVGPGQINPLSTRRLRPTWRVDEALPRALDLFRRIETASGEPLFHPRPILRILKDEAQARDLAQRKSDADASRWIRDATSAESECVEKRLRAPFGAFVTVGGGWLDVPRFIETARNALGADNDARWLPPDAMAPPDPSVPPGGKESGPVIWCEGWRARNNPLWETLDHNPAKGEWMRVRLGDPLGVEAIVNGPSWIQPLPDGTARAGATYAWSSFESGSTADAQITLIKNLSATYAGPFTILSQHVGVRPIVRDTRPVIGQHPGYPRHWILNGLGSKGALHGPWAAHLLADALLDGKAPPREVDVKRFFQ